MQHELPFTFLAERLRQTLVMREHVEMTREPVALLRSGEQVGDVMLELPPKHDGIGEQRPCLRLDPRVALSFAILSLDDVFELFDLSLEVRRRARHVPGANLPVRVVRSRTCQMSSWSHVRFAASSWRSTSSLMSTAASFRTARSAAIHGASACLVEVKIGLSTSPAQMDQSEASTPRAVHRLQVVAKFVE
jgi:hypothetical protein